MNAHGIVKLERSPEVYGGRLLRKGTLLEKLRTAEHLKIYDGWDTTYTDTSTDIRVNPIFPWLGYTIAAYYAREENGIKIYTMRSQQVWSSSTADYLLCASNYAPSTLEICETWFENPPVLWREAGMFVPYFAEDAYLYINVMDKILKERSLNVKHTSNQKTLRYWLKLLSCKVHNR